MTKTKALAIPETTLPVSEDDLVEYGRDCLRVGKIATEQFGKACQALLDGPGSWTQRRVAEAMECAQSTVNAALAEIGATKIAIDREPIKNDLDEPEDPVWEATVLSDEIQLGDTRQLDDGCPVQFGKDVKSLKGLMRAYTLDCDPESASQIADVLRTYLRKFEKIAKEAS